MKLQTALLCTLVVSSFLATASASNSNSCSPRPKRKTGLKTPVAVPIAPTDKVEWDPATYISPTEMSMTPSCPKIIGIEKEVSSFIALKLNLLVNCTTHYIYHTGYKDRDYLLSKTL
jgi:hypothetical protein